MGRRKKIVAVEETKEKFSRTELENKIFSKRILTGKEVQEKLDSSSSLIRIVKDSTNRLISNFQGSNNLVFVADHSGCIVCMFGDEQLNARLVANFVMAGTYPNEDSILAKAIGGAIIGGQPNRFDGKSLIPSNNEEWTAVGVPIHDADEEIVGALVFASSKTNITNHSLVLTNLMADLVHQNFVTEQRESNYRTSLDYHNSVFNQHPFANLTVNNSGIITNISRQAAIFFGVLENELIGSNIANILPEWNEIWLRIEKGTKVENINVELNNVPGTLDFLLSVAPVFLSDATITGAILAFRDLKKVNNVVNRYTGSWASYNFNDIIGISVPIKKTIELAKKIALESTPVLITGEVGIGKEVFAQSIHNSSVRSENGFVRLVLQTMPQNEIECELFGFEEGVFPGIKRVAQPGKFELAHGGTLFIDEISLLPLALQDKLLSAIRKGVITRVGGKKQVKVDVRIIASTTKDLRMLIHEEKFKLDLFYLLTENPLAIPPLRERRHDVPLFINHYLQVKAREQGKVVPVIPKRIVRILARYEWPQNIRELAKLIDFVVSVNGNFGSDAKNEREFKKKYLFLQQREDIDGIKTIDELERDAIIHALQVMKGNMSKATRKLGISRNTLYLKCKRYGIDI